MKLNKSKNGQSQIITTVLLILLVLVAVGFIISFVIPFVNDKLESGKCLDVINKVHISNGYTCYKSGTSSGTMQVQVGIAEISSLIDGFAIELGGASSQVVKIIGSSGSGANMCGEAVGTIEVPLDNTERTYLINPSPKPDFVRVSAILKGGEICPESQTIITVANCITGENTCDTL